jgi:hypothetical protein
MFVTPSNINLAETDVMRSFKGSFYQFWLDRISMPYRGGSEAAVRPVCVYGLEHLQDSLKRGSGAILWESGYFGRSNLAKHIFTKRVFHRSVHAAGHTGGFGASSDTQSWTRERIILPFFDSCERSFVRDIIYLRDRIHSVTPGLN